MQVRREGEKREEGKGKSNGEDDACLSDRQGIGWGKSTPLFPFLFSPFPCNPGNPDCTRYTFNTS